MTPVERVELAELRTEMLQQFENLRADMARGFRDLTIREDDTRERVAKMEGGLGMVRWLGPGGLLALLLGMLAQAGVIHV